MKHSKISVLFPCMKYNLPALVWYTSKKAGKAGRDMSRLGWIVTGIGLIAILGGLLYPMDVITKKTFLVLLIAGALMMFIGSMIRTVAILKKK